MAPGSGLLQMPRLSGPPPAPRHCSPSVGVSLRPQFQSPLSFPPAEPLSVQGLHTLDSSDLMAGLSCWKLDASIYSQSCLGHGLIRIKVALLIFRRKPPPPGAVTANHRSPFPWSACLGLLMTLPAPKVSKHLILFSPEPRCSTF